MAKGRIPYRKWFFRIFAWDAFLPVGIAIIPWVIESLRPGDRGLMEIFAVVMPIGAFFARLVMGYRQIGANRCSDLARSVQFCFFFLGILPLVLIECALVLSHIMPRGAFDARSDGIVLLIMVGIYLSCMTIAMYPGRNPATDVDAEDDPFASSWRGMHDEPFETE